MSYTPISHNNNTGEVKWVTVIVSLQCDVLLGNYRTWYSWMLFWCTPMAATFLPPAAHVLRQTTKMIIQEQTTIWSRLDSDRTETSPLQSLRLKDSLPMSRYHRTSFLNQCSWNGSRLHHRTDTGIHSQTIHPAIIYHCLTCTGLTGGSLHKGGVHPGRVGSSSRGWQGDKQPCSLTFTPTGNLESPINLYVSRLWTMGLQGCRSHYY